MPAHDRRLRHSLAALGIVAAVLLVASGCGQEKQAAGDLLGPNAAGADLSGVGSDLPQLNLSDLPSDLNLSTEQKTGMQAALERLRQDRQRMRGAMGRGKDRRHPDAGPPSGDRQPPLFAFLESSSQILNADQFLILARFLSDRREAHAGPTGPAMRGGFRGGLPGRAAQALGLTADQQESLRATIEAHAAQGRDLWQSLVDEKIPAEQARAQARTIAADLKAEVQKILTAEQWAKVEAFRQTMRERIGDRKHDNADHGGSRHAEFLGRILNLSDEQLAQVKAALDQAAPRRQAVLEQLKSGSVGPEEIPILMWQIQKETSAEIRALLTPEQAARYDALRDLLPLGPGRGHGMGMMPGIGLGSI
jgi:hypothetical protein